MLLNDAAGQQGDRPAQPEHLPLVVKNDQHGPMRCFAAGHGQYPFRLGLGQAVGRLVYAQQRGIGREQPRYRHEPLSHERKLHDRRLQIGLEVAETDALENLHRPLRLLLGRGRKPQGRLRQHVLEQRRSQQSAVLADELRTVVVRERPVTVPALAPRSQRGKRLVESGERPQKRRLAGARGTDESDDTALGNLEIEARENDARPVSDTETLERQAALAASRASVGRIFGSRIHCSKHSPKCGTHARFAVRRPAVTSIAKTSRFPNLNDALRGRLRDGTSIPRNLLCDKAIVVEIRMRSIIEWRCRERARSFPV